MIKIIKLILVVFAINLLNGCLDTLYLSQNIRSDLLMNFEQKSNISATYNNIVIAPDKIDLIKLKKDGTVKGRSRDQYTHNIKFAFQSILSEYMSTKFNTMLKSEKQITLSVVLTDYRICIRDISAKGQKAMAVMLGNADLRTEYSAELKCKINLVYNGESYEKEFSVKENDQDLTQLRTESISIYNNKIGNSSASYTTQSSTNTLDNGITNCLNNAHMRVIINIDKVVNDIIGNTNI